MNHRTSGFFVAIFVAGAALAGACGGEQPPVEAPPQPPPPPAEPAPAPPPTAEPAPTATSAPAPTAEAPKEPPKPQWKDMSFDQRKQHMIDVVMPKMKTLLSGFDPKKFKEVTCATCHGKDGEKNGFKMPNPKLPKLDPKDGFKKHMQGKMADMTKFMMEKVTPEMVALLPGVAPYDPNTHQGFGCFGCHPPPK